MAVSRYCKESEMQLIKPIKAFDLYLTEWYGFWADAVPPRLRENLLGVLHVTT